MNYPESIYKVDIYSASRKSVNPALLNEYEDFYKLALEKDAMLFSKGIEQILGEKPKEDHQYSIVEFDNHMRILARWIKQENTFETFDKLRQRYHQTIKLENHKKGYIGFGSVSMGNHMSIY